MKRLLALLLAMILLVAMFAACTPTDTGDGDTGSSDTGNKDTDTKDTDTKDTDTEDTEDQPKEIEAKTLTLLNSMQVARCEMTYDDAIAKGDALALYLDEMALTEFGLILDRTNIEDNAFMTSLNGYIAGGTLQDAFPLGSLDADSCFSLVNQGKLADMDAIFDYSNGLAYSIYYGDNAPMGYNRAVNLLGDGKWYWFNPANCLSLVINLDKYAPNGDYLPEFGVFTVYPTLIRYDWLQKVGMEVPTTMDEIYDALVAFQAEDVNGNGTADERAMFTMGAAGQYGGGFSNYYGLYTRYQMNNWSGEVSIPQLQPGYLAYQEFCKKLYEAGVAYIGEGGIWNMGVDVAGDYCATHVQYAENQFPNTGNPEAEMRVIGVIQAVEGIKPAFNMQSAASSLGAMSFSSKADYEACARFLDFINSDIYCNGLTMGVKGVAWDYIDGNITSIELTEEQKTAGYGSGWRFMIAGYGPQVTLQNYYDAYKTYQTDIQDLLDSGWTSSGWGGIGKGEPSHEAWVTEQVEKRGHEWVTLDTPDNTTAIWQSFLDFGPENINFVGASGHLPSYAQPEESEVTATYLADLNTYMDELDTGFITGVNTPDMYDDLIQFAYDNLGLGEVLAAYQARANRTLVAMGRDPIE